MTNDFRESLALVFKTLRFTTSSFIKNLFNWKAVCRFFVEEPLYYGASFPKGLARECEIESDAESDVSEIFSDNGFVDESNSGLELDSEYSEDDDDLKTPSTMLESS